MTAKGATTTAAPVAIYRLILPIVFWLGAWGLLQPAAAQEAELLLLQTRGRLYDLALSPDRSVLAVGGDNNAVHLWNPTNGEHLRTLDASRQGTQVADQQALSGYISSVAFHPDKPLLATGGTDWTVSLWDYQSGSAVYTLSGHRGPVRAVAFHPAGGVLASAGGDGTILLWNINNGQRLGVLRAHQDTVHALAFSDDGNRLASAGEDTTVRLWDFASGRLLHTLSGHRDRVVALAFHPLSTTLASAGQDGTIRVWQQDTGALERVLTAHQDAVTDLAFQPGLGQLASVGLDGRMLLWELSIDNPSEPVPPQEHSIAAVRLVGEDTAVTASLDGVVRFWNLKEGRSRLALTLLPENQWLSYDPSSLYYNASARGDRYGMLRFAGLEQTLFPLHYYRDKLFQP
ncbi:MAG: WD40 repeat domain-containing protein, partial [Candidatus Competibacteraceae bacterium]|nr:WD40 repeat domain-containing protein [Candidatus Competibacteraceae bacterium]